MLRLHQVQDLADRMTDLSELEFFDDIMFLGPGCVSTLSKTRIR